MSSSHLTTTCGEHDECMICLSPLLEGENDDDDDIYIEGPEVGAVWPCGHCFHLHCWQRYGKDKCPICNQPANLFSKIFISAPPAAAAANSSGELTPNERRELENYRRMAREQEGPEERMLLRDMERQVRNDPAGAINRMTMMMMVQSRDLRRAERALMESEEEREMNQEILKIAQTELEQANKELAQLKPKNEELQEEVEGLKKAGRDERARRSQAKEESKQVAKLQEKLDRAKEKLALKNKQLSRRNKELATRKKLIGAQQKELASRGKEHQKACKRTSVELENTKRELELLKELDSFTMDGSSTSLGLSMIWD